MAILAVLAFTYHHGLEQPTPAGRAAFRVLDQGLHGVDLFFVLSGFLITGILADAKCAPHGLRNFYVRRALRILPVYYGVLAVALVLVPLAAPAKAHYFADAARHQGWLWAVAANVVLARENAWVLGRFDHYWSLAVEEQFYLVWPLVVWAVPRRRLMVFCVACVALAAALRVAFVLSGRPVAAYVLTACRMDGLAIGAFLALAARGPGGLAAVRPWASGVSVVAAALLVAYFVVQPNDLMFSYSLYVFLSGGVVVWAVCARPGSWAGRVWESRALQFCGRHSYAAYALMWPLGLGYEALFPMSRLAAWTGSALVGWALHIGLASAATLAAAWACWHLYEKHFLKLKGRFPQYATADAGSQNRQSALVE